MDKKILNFVGRIGTSRIQGDAANSSWQARKHYFRIVCVEITYSIIRAHTYVVDNSLSAPLTLFSFSYTQFNREWKNKKK